MPKKTLIEEMIDDENKIIIDYFSDKVLYVNLLACLYPDDYKKIKRIGDHKHDKRGDELVERVILAKEQLKLFSEIKEFIEDPLIDKFCVCLKNKHFSKEILDEVRKELKMEERRLEKQEKENLRMEEQRKRDPATGELRDLEKEAEDKKKFEKELADDEKERAKVNKG